MKYLGKKHILNSAHGDFIQDIIAQQTKQTETIQSIRVKLKHHFIINEKLSEATISRCLHSHLRLSYKKQANVKQKTMTPSGVAEVAKWAEVINTLIDRGSEVAFVDEFSVNSRTYKQYEWSSVGSKSLFWKMPNQFSTSFMVGLSKWGYYPVIDVNGTF